MLVEDNAMSQQMLNEHLVDCGYQVQCLSGGEGFDKEVADFQPDLILLEVNLRDLDGCTLLTQIRQRSDWRHIRVIVITTLSFSSHRARALSLGVSHYLVKPVDLGDLKQAIQDELVCV